MRSYLRQVQKRNQKRYERMLSDYEKMLSQWIDNLPFSIRPKHFEEFKKNLLWRLMYRRRPEDPPFLETMYQCFKGELEDNDIHVSKKQMLEHTIMFMSLMDGPYLTDDDFEYELKGENITDKYQEIFKEPIKISQSNEVLL